MTAGWMVGLALMLQGQLRAEGGPPAPWEPGAAHLEVDPRGGGATLRIPLLPSIGTAPGPTYQPILQGYLSPCLSHPLQAGTGLAGPVTLTAKVRFSLSPGSLQIRERGEKADATVWWTYPDGNGDQAQDPSPSALPAPEAWAPYDDLVRTGGVVLQGLGGGLVFLASPIADRPKGSVPDLALVLREGLVHAYKRFPAPAGSGTTAHYRLVAVHRKDFQPLEFTYGTQDAVFTTTLGAVQVRLEQGNPVAWPLTPTLDDLQPWVTASGHGAEDSAIALDCHVKGPGGMAKTRLMVLAHPGPVGLDTIQVLSLQADGDDRDLRFTYTKAPAIQVQGTQQTQHFAPTVVETIGFGSDALRFDWEAIPADGADPVSDWIYGVRSIQGPRETYRRQAAVSPLAKPWERQSKHRIQASGSSSHCQTHVRDRRWLVPPKEGYGQGPAKGVDPDGWGAPTLVFDSDLKTWHPAPGAVSREVTWAPGCVLAPDLHLHPGHPGGLKGGMPPPRPGKVEVWPGPISYNPGKKEVTMGAYMGVRPPPPLLPETGYAPSAMPTVLSMQRSIAVNNQLHQSIAQFGAQQQQLRDAMTARLSASTEATRQAAAADVKAAMARGPIGGQSRPWDNRAQREYAARAAAAARAATPQPASGTPEDDDSAIEGEEASPEGAEPLNAQDLDEADEEFERAEKELSLERKKEQEALRKEAEKEAREAIEQRARAQQSKDYVPDINALDRELSINANFIRSYDWWREGDWLRDPFKGDVRSLMLQMEGEAALAKAPCTAEEKQARELERQKENNSRVEPLLATNRIIWERKGALPDGNQRALSSLKKLRGFMPHPNKVLVLLWNWHGLGLGGKDASVGHVALAMQNPDKSTWEIIHSQYPHEFGGDRKPFGPNTTIQDPNNIFNTQNKKVPDHAYIVKINNTEKFFNAVEYDLQKHYWSFNPEIFPFSTNCTYGAIECLTAGDVNLPILWPRRAIVSPLAPYIPKDIEINLHLLSTFRNEQSCERNDLIKEFQWEK